MVGGLAMGALLKSSIAGPRFWPMRCSQRVRTLSPGQKGCTKKALSPTCVLAGRAAWLRLPDTAL
jgi:hypothetical protein